MDRGSYQDMRDRLTTALQKLRAGRSQGHGSYRKNPFLYVYNPPMHGRHPYRAASKYPMQMRAVGIIADEVHDIRYEHIEDGKPYEHTFESPTIATAAIMERTGQHVVVLENKDPMLHVWEDR